MGIFHSKTKWLFATMMLIANHIMGQSMTSCGSTVTNQQTIRFQSVTFHNGSLYVSESNPGGAGMVLRIAPGTGVISATNNNQLDFPTGVAVHPTSGRVYVNQRGFINPVNNNIQIYNNNLGTPIANLQASGANEMSDALLIDDRGRLFVNIITNIGGTITGQIRVYDINGGTPTLININGSSNFFTTNRYHSMAFRRVDANTIQLYATNFGNNTVSIFTITDNNFMTNRRDFPTNNGGNNTAGITVTNDGFIHVGTGGLTNHNIRTFCEDGTLLNTLFVSVQANGRLNGLTSNGNTIFVAEDVNALTTNQRIFCYNFTPPQFQLSVSSRNIYCSNENFITLNLNLPACSSTNSYTVEIYQNNVLINTVSPIVINNTTLQIPMLASGTYQVRVIGANPAIISSFSNIFSVFPSYQATLNGSITTTVGNSVNVPVNITGTTPSPSNPIGVTLIRTNMSGASVSIPVTITSVPFIYTDNTISSAGTYTYTIQNNGSSCSTNSGNFIATLTDTTPCATGDLWGKDTSFDTGDESISCNNGATAWQSPDIWLSPSASAYNDDTDRAPIPGTTNYVYVRVRNRGNDTDAGRLRLYWAAASTGLYWANSWTGGDFCNNGTPLGGEILGNIVDENGNTLTTNDINHLANQTKVYRFAWVVPNPSDYASCFFNNLPIDKHHFCLLARIEQDATNCRPTQPANESTSTYLNATCNNNIFWQNVMIIEKDAKGSFSCGVGVMGECRWKAVPKTTTTSVNTEVSPCQRSMTKLTWMPVIESKGKPDFWNFGQLFIRVDNTVYNNWLNSGAQGTGIVDMGGGLFQILEPNASMSFDLSYGQRIGINHYFVPLTANCIDVDIDLKQENCILSSGTCSIIGGERFSLRGFCGSGLVLEKQSNTFSWIVNVYPNPAQDNLTIEFTEEQKEISFYITDTQGRVIKEKTLFNHSQKVNVNVAKIPSGIYLIHIQNGKGETSVQRFVKQ